jgi:hypothetical protein
MKDQHHEVLTVGVFMEAMKEIKERFEQIDGKFDSVDARFGTTDIKISNISSVLLNRRKAE